MTAVRAIAVDANLLLLLVVGLADPNQIETFKRTRQYSRADFDLLARVLQRFQSIVCTPNVWTEVSNLAGQLAGDRRTKAFMALKVLASSWQEEYVVTAQATGQTSFARLGLTDAALCSLPVEVAVLTDDLDLYLESERTGRTTINFTHIRAAGWAAE